jgi:uncharacterized protein YeaO (DUF488 family)
MPSPLRRLQIKRAYDPPARSDGVRILVDRLWPRGVRKEDADLDEWRKDVAPSSALREFYGHRPERFAEFAKRYRAELRRADSKQAVDELLALARRRRVTLVTATRDLEHSGAAVLASHLEGVAARRATSASPRRPRRSRH